MNATPRGRIATRLLAVAGVLALGLAGFTARAGTITVNSYTDAPATASALAAGLCADSGGACTLRAAVQVADAAPAPSTIVVPAGTYNLTVTGVDEAPSSVTSPTASVVYSSNSAIGDLNISQSMAIQGAGANTTIIQWDPSVPLADRDRIFHVEVVNANITVSISGVTVKNGYTPAPVVLSTISPTAVVEFIRYGAGIASGPGAVIETVNPQATHGPGSGGGSSEGHGGGSEGHGGESGFAVEQLTLTGVHVLDNQAGSDGGGIASAAPLVLRNSIISGNSAGANGGGLYNDATLTMTETTIGTTGTYTVGNDAENGGGLFDTGSHETTINMSAIVGNSATGGAGISARRLVYEEITNTTIANNVAQDTGGGITTNGRALLTNDTVADNFVASDSEGGGAGLNSFGPVSGGPNAEPFTLVNTLLSGNLLQGTTTAVANCGATGGSPVLERFLSLGHNLENGNTCGFSAPGDLNDTDPLLKALAANGGPTETMALSSTLATPPDTQTSPAVDAGDNGYCPNNDQRDSLRPADGNLDGSFICDIGAYELFVPYADLHINDMAAPNSVFVGDSFAVTVEVHVDPAANSPSQGVQVVTDALPSGLVLNSETVTTPSGTSGCSVTARVVTCNAGNLAPNETATMQLNLTATMVGTRSTITAHVSQTSPVDPDLTNNTASVSVRTFGVSDLGISASGVTTPVAVGSATDVAFTVRNIVGSDTAGPVTVGISLPLGVTYQSATIGGGSCNASDPTAILCTVSSLAAGSAASGTLTVTGAVEGEASIVFGTYAPQRDGNSVNNSTVVTLTIQQQSNLGVGVSGGTTPLGIGSNTDLSFTVSNAGPNAAAPVTLDIAIPSGVTYQSATIAGGSCDAGNPAALVCTVPSIAAGANAKGTLTVTGAARGSASVVFVVSAPQYDADTTDNTATVTLTVQEESNLGVSASGAATSVDVGASADLSFTVSNAGPDAAAPVTLDIAIPSGVTYQSATIAGGSCDAGNPAALVCTVPSIAAGAGASGTLTVTGASEGSASVVFKVSAPQYDADTTDNTATVTLTVQALSDLGIGGSITPNPVGSGDQATLALTVTNQGPADAANVVVETTLPSGLSLASSAGGSNCTSSGGTVTCDLGTLAAGKSADVGFDVTVDASAGTVQVTSSVSSDQTDPNMANNSKVLSLSVLPVQVNGGGGGGATSPLGLLALLSALVAVLFRRRRRVVVRKD